MLPSRIAVYEDLPETPAGFEADAPLTDPQGRIYDYLRLSVADRCDLACVYCMPPEGEREQSRRVEVLSFEEIANVVRVFARGGVKRVRLTGGEPLVRKDIVDLVRLLRTTTSVEQLAMTTNATRLAELAAPLRDAGLSGVNISIDSLDDARFEMITRGGDLSQVRAGIDAALRAGLEVKLNTVLMRSQTLDEARAIVEFAWGLGVTPRFIELMPIGEGASLPLSERVPASEVKARLGGLIDETVSFERVQSTGPAKYAVAADGSNRRVGFITPMSQEFCGDCNRIRVTARGDIRACLASRRAISLRDLLRAGASDARLSWAIHWALGIKSSGHAFLDREVDEHQKVGMSLIGG
ncbi:MAG: GTP 3',8-cyclase MoaA [Polyangiales bacterium]